MEQKQDSYAHYHNIIAEAWESRAGDVSKYKNDIFEILKLLDSGKIRVAQKQDAEWVVNQWVKKAILLSFKVKETSLIKGGPGNSTWFDKFPQKFENWESDDFINHKIRAVPGAFARYTSFFENNVVLMPSFVNVGAYIGENTLIDTYASIGSCAQIGKNCHISQCVGIAGVLEPLQANPVIIEDNCFIGTNSQIAEGVIIEEGSVLGMGVNIGASTKIIDRETGDVFYGKVPRYSVVVPGSTARKESEPSISCAVIVKKTDQQTRQKTSINDLLRS